MCGIAGFIGFEEKSDYALKANLIQKHRGPDDQSIWEDDYISLSHQRLSIIDVNERSNQPFSKHNYILVFNGEIYNYEEIKRELKEKYNSKFLTTSDTEVILEAYHHMGITCLDLFIGMFAFCIYDTKTQKTLIARDHFGIKPLFYFHKNKKLAFSSELKTLAKLNITSKKINKEALLASINYLWIPNDLCMFDDVTKLEPGSFVLFKNDGSLTKKSYWSTKTLKNTINNEIKAVEKIDEELNKTIDRHLIADVPVSSFLSGGLDSSLISVMANNHLKKLNTYTIATSEKDKKIEKMPEDEKFAKKLAQKENFKHHEIVVYADIIDLLPKMIYALDEPIGDPAAINTYLISKQASDNGEKVLLSGMGADEIFFGYRRHKATLLALKYNKLPSLIKEPINFGVNLFPVKTKYGGLKLIRWAKRFLSFTGLEEHETYMRSYSYYDKKELNEIFNDDYSTEISSLYERHKIIFNENYNNDLANKICYTDIHMFMQGLNLTYTDRASMAASVEVRVPFIDRDFIATTMAIKGSLKNTKGVSKYILKKAAEKYLPKEIIYREKASFGAPIRSWISNELKEMVDTHLSEKQVTKRGIFNYAFIKDMIDKDREGGADYAYQIYQLLTIEIWFREFID